MNCRLIPLLVIAALQVSAATRSAEGAWEASLTRLEFLGEARLRGGLEVDGTVLGGLSGLTYDAQHDVYYVISDDPSGRHPARFYTLKLDLSGGRLDPDGVSISGVTLLQGSDGRHLAPLSVDAEGIAWDGAGGLFISSEGQANRSVPPFVRRFHLDGRLDRELAVPREYLPESGRSVGVRHNLGLESLTLTPDGRYLITATENALVQDGVEAGVETRSPCRILKFDSATGQAVAEFVYWTEPLAAPASIPNGLQVAGLVELLALGEEQLLALERSFAVGVGNTVRLFEVSLAGATDLRGLTRVTDRALTSIPAAQKRLLLDLDEVGVHIDNLEGMSFGPRLADGRRTLVLVSDDNFNSALQVTQLLAFAVDDQPIDIAAVQGGGHRSPFEGQWVRHLRAVVTAVAPGDRDGFWVEGLRDHDRPATFNGLKVEPSAPGWRPQPGDSLLLSGRIVEVGAPGELPVTTLRTTGIEHLASGVPLAEPVRLGEGGGWPPSEVVDDDGLLRFDPSFDGIDFWESLEGMRLAVTDALVVGPTTRFGEIGVVAAAGARATSRTLVGGLLLHPGDANPERLTVDLAWLSERPSLNVGDRVAGDLIGILDYGLGEFRLRCLSPVAAAPTRNLQPERTMLRSARRRLTIATFNVDNLSPETEEWRLRALAEAIASALAGPDLLGLQEIQDDSGAEDNGITSSGRTLERLIGAVEAAGGPTYRYRQIDPRDGRDGGRPGANVRVAWLFNPRRVRFVDRGRAGATDRVGVVGRRSGPRLTLSPGRVAPLAPAFEGDEKRGFEPSRKSLVAEVLFAGRRLFVINNHFTSKRRDAALFGSVQPPPRVSEDQRSQQASWVAELVGELEAVDPAAMIIVLGDLNEHEFRSPLRVLMGSRLVNLIETLPVEDRYTYNFRGNSQTLDHILVSRGLLERAQARIDIVHLNADFASHRRASDHDPVIVELDFAARP